ncbi:MAG: S-layer homology domain-containing protein [Clostridiales bacterium]|jgi:alpha-tubulin suppressor-like RCC1 family protein|nr:S-layer homology domain-containing protein [Clostridiales bacterium]MDR2712932.1 S-layer homology domain-containing protein [Clostridiales bacterium]
MKRKLTIMICLLCLTLTGVFFAFPPAQAAHIRQVTTPVSGGMNHSLIIKSDGTVWASGDNASDQLGLGKSVEASPTFSKVEGLSAISSVAAGHFFSVACNSLGTVYVWGGSTYEYPTAVTEITNVTAVAAGQSNILAIKSDGTVWQWAYGNKPQQVSGLKNIAAIAAGSAHYLALSHSGDIYAWGDNSKGQLGIGAAEDITQPQRIHQLVNIVSIAAGSFHSLAVSISGDVYAWGSNADGELGIGIPEGSTLPQSSRVPVKVKNIQQVKQVAAGNGTSYALTGEGEVYAWGYGEYGQLGRGSEIMSLAEPKEALEFSGAGNPVFIASGSSHCFCVLQDGSRLELFAWGRNRNGQLGAQQAGSVNIPQKVLDDISMTGNYTTDKFSGASLWAVPELIELDGMNIAPLILWDNYAIPVTRAEMTCVLVTIYENVKGISASTGNVMFQDIEYHPLETYVKKAFNLKIVLGRSETEFAPNDNITRQEAAKMICDFVAVMEDIDIPIVYPPLSAIYEDAQQIAEWAIPYVYYAYINNIMKGNGTDFTPRPVNGKGGNLTRQETLAMMRRLVEQYGWLRENGN